MNDATRPLADVMADVVPKMSALVVMSPDPEKDILQVWRQYAMYWLSGSSAEDLHAFLTAICCELGHITEDNSVAAEVMQFVKVQQKVVQDILRELEENTLPASDNTVFCRMLTGTSCFMRLLLVALQQGSKTDSVDDDVYTDCRESMLMFTQTMQQQVEERHSFESIQLAYMKTLQMQTTKALAHKARDAQTIKKLKAENKKLQARNAEMEDIMNMVSAAVKKKHDLAVGRMEEADGPESGAAGSAAGSAAGGE